MRMTKGVIEFVEPNDSGYYKSEAFEITDHDVKVLEKQIQKISDEIINFEFWNKGCKEPDCEYCVLRSYIGN